MTCTYTLENGRKIKIDIWNHLLEPGKKVCYRDQYCTGNEAAMKTLEVLMDPDNKDMYFMLDGEIKSFDDFDYLPLEEFIKRAHQGEIKRGQITCQDFVATLLKESDNIGFVFPIYQHDRIRIPIETEKTSKIDWGNKITLQSEGLIEELNTRDLFSLLLSGDVKLINRNQVPKADPLAEGLERILRIFRKPR